MVGNVEVTRAELAKQKLVSSSKCKIAKKYLSRRTVKLKGFVIHLILKIDAKK